MRFLRALMSGMRAHAKVEFGVEVKGPFGDINKSVGRYRAAHEDAIRSAAVATGRVQNAIEVLDGLDAEAADAEDLAEKFRDRFGEGEAPFVSLPYSLKLHVGILIAVIAGEYIAGALSIQAGFEGEEAYEVIGIPAGLVFGLILSAHNLGILLKGWHAALCVRAMNEEDGDSLLPNASIFGDTRPWLWMTMLSGAGIACGSMAALAVRANQAANSAPPRAFMFIAIAIAIGAAGEAFLWYNPWQRAWLDATAMARLRRAQAAELRARLVVLATEASLSRERPRRVKVEAVELLEFLRSEADQDLRLSRDAGRGKRVESLRRKIELIDSFRQRIDELIPEVEPL